MCEGPIKQYNLAWSGKYEEERERKEELYYINRVRPGRDLNRSIYICWHLPALLMDSDQMKMN